MMEPITEANYLIAGKVVAINFFNLIVIAIILSLQIVTGILVESVMKPKN